MTVPINKVTARPDLASYGQLLKRDVMSSIKCHAIGTIQGFDSSNQSALVTLNYKNIVNGLTQDYPVLIDCPCIVLGGGGGYLSFPIQVGDTCLILFNDNDMDNWVHSGQVVEPSTGRVHSFADAIALVGLRSFAQAIGDYDGDNVELNSKGALLSLKNEVTDLKTLLNGLIDAIETFVATGVVSSGAGAGGTLSFTAGTTAFDAYKDDIAGLLK